MARGRVHDTDEVAEVIVHLVQPIEGDEPVIVKVVIVVAGRQNDGQ